MTRKDVLLSSSSVAFRLNVAVPYGWRGGPISGVFTGFAMP
jgi:hypothetical protein